MYDPSFSHRRPRVGCFNGTFSPSRRQMRPTRLWFTCQPSAYNWRKRFGGMGKSQLSELRSLEKENARLKKIVAELELDKLILKESLSHLKPRA